MTTLNLATIKNLPEVATSHTREITWAVDWYAGQYAQAGYDCELAWKLYDNAIENNDPQQLIDDLFVIAKMFEAIKINAWHGWQNAKRDYLALMN